MVLQQYFSEPACLSENTTYYKNRSDEEYFYRVATGYAKVRTASDIVGDFDSDTYLVREQYFDFADDDDFAEVSNNVMKTSCKDARCLLSKRRSGLSNSTVAAWLLWNQISSELGEDLYATFTEEFAKVLIPNASKTKRDSAFVVFLEGEKEDVTVVSTYSAIILTVLLALAFLAVVISEIVRRKRWKFYGVDITHLARNKLFCQLYNKSRLNNDEDCLEDARDL